MATGISMIEYPFFYRYYNLALWTPMVITSKYDGFKGKINGILNNNNYEYDSHFNSKKVNKQLRQIK